MKKLIVIMILLTASSAFSLDLKDLSDAPAITTQAHKAHIVTELEANRAAIVAVSGQAPAENGDDPRLKNMYGILCEIAKKGQLEQPLSITPETYALMSEAVLKKLGDNIIVIPNNFIIDGVPTKKIAVDWPVIRNRVVQAVHEENAPALNKLFKTFTLKPLSGRDILSANYKLPTQQAMFFHSLNLIPFNERDKKYSGLALLQKFAPTLQQNDPWAIVTQVRDNGAAHKYCLKNNIDEKFVKIVQRDYKMIEQLATMFPTFKIYHAK